jgi:hypothetical protein
MPRYASFDRSGPEPHLVTGWLDADALDYGDDLPAPDSRIEMSEAEWAARTIGHYVVEDGKLVPFTPPVAPHPIPKALIVERLIAEGALRAVRAELGFGKADDELDDAQLALRERWDAAASFMSDDEALRAALRRATVDPDVILAG